jgi:hypothetical protein
LEIDELAFEVFVEDRLDFGKIIEPFENGFAAFVVLEAMIELIAKGVRETSDFAGASFHNSDFLCKRVAGGVRHPTSDRKSTD